MILSSLYERGLVISLPDTVVRQSSDTRPRAVFQRMQMRFNSVSTAEYTLQTHSIVGEECHSTLIPVRGNDSGKLYELSTSLDHNKFWG